jgi:hypothetical protein
MKSLREQFLQRLFSSDAEKWWSNLTGEQRQGNKDLSCRFLEETIQEELSDIPEYRSADRRLFFFSNNNRLSIDGLYKGLGVEEKVLPRKPNERLKLFDCLVDGAIHRGVIWVAGNPQGVEHPIEALTVFVLGQNCKPMEPGVVDLYLPILTALHKFNIQVEFVNGETGQHWSIANHLSMEPVPTWLGEKQIPSDWDLKLEEINDVNLNGLRILSDETAVSKLQKIRDSSGSRPLFPGRKSGKNRFDAYQATDSSRIAIVDCPNEFRVIEYGFLLRSAGYDAVKVNFDPNFKGSSFGSSSTDVPLRVAKFMKEHFAVILGWGQFPTLLK